MRSYDAELWFSQLAQAGVDPMPLIIPAEAASRRGFQAAYNLLVGGAEPRLQGLWAPSYLTDPRLGADWTLTGAGRGNLSSGAIYRVRLHEGETETFSSDPFSSAVGFLANDAASADIWEFRVNGTVRINDERLDVRLPNGTIPFCVADDGCSGFPADCKKPRPVAALEHTNGVLMAYGGSKLTSVAVTAESVENYCGNKAYAPGFACWLVSDSDLHAVVGGTRVVQGYGFLLPKPFGAREGIGSSCAKGVVASPGTDFAIVDAHGLNAKSRRGFRMGIGKRPGQVKGVCDAAAYDDGGAGGSLICLTGDHVFSMSLSGGKGDHRADVIELARRAVRRIKSL